MELLKLLSDPTNHPPLPPPSFPLLLCPSARYATPEEDFEIAIRSYEWPRKIVDIMKEATTKVRESGGEGVCMCVFERECVREGREKSE